MLSKTSFFNKTIFHKNIMHFWPIWFGYLLVCLFELPIGIFFSVRNTNYFSNDATAEMIQNEKTMAFISHIADNIQPAVVAVAALVVAMAVLSYLYTGRCANMMHSLPVRREELFFTNYISGLLFLIIPEVIASFIGIFVCVANGITELQYLMIWVLETMGMSFFFYSFAMFVGMFTGVLLAFPVCYLILNFLQIGMKSILRMLMSLVCFGVNSNYQEGMADVLSPIYFMQRNVGVNVNYVEDYKYQYDVYGEKIVLAYVAVGVVFFCLALLTYKKRRIEVAGDVIAVKWAKPLFRWGMSICAGILGGMAVGSAFLDMVSAKGEFVIALVATLISGCIFFFVAEMLLEKKFKVFRKKRMLEYAGIGVFLCVILFAMEWDVFGVEKKIPNADEVEWVSMDMGMNVVAQDKESIQEIEAIHQKIISEKSEIEAYNAGSKNDSYSMTIQYKMKDDTKLIRGYYIPISGEMLKSDDSIAKSISAVSEKPDNYLKGLFNLDYKNNSLLGGYFETYEKTDQGLQEQDITFDESKADIIYSAIQQDVEEGNFHTVQMYMLCSDEEWDDEVYANCISIDYYNKSGVQNTNDLIYDYGNSDARMYSASSYYGTSSSGYITFGKDCKHTIQALIDTGMIEDESDLITQKVMRDNEIFY